VPGRESRRGRLTRSADFDRVYRKGSSHSTRTFVLHTFPRGDEDQSRLGLSISRKVGGAVERNLVKRLVREAFDAKLEKIAPGCDLVVAAREGSAELADREGLAGVEKELDELLTKAELVASP
jgi:ribonuclease P protein component